MDQLKPDIWRDLAVLLAVGEAQSSFAAARVLGISHQAVAMRVEQLETRTGETLVDRSGAQWVLTDAGRGLVQKTRSIVDLVERGAAAGKGHRTEAQTLVFSCPDLFFEYLILPLWYRLEAQVPNVGIELHAVQGITDQHHKGYDLALCLSKSLEPGLVGQNVGTLRFRLYGHRKLLGPQAPQSAPSHFTVDNPLLSVPDLVWPGGQTTRRVICADLLTVATAIKAGRGIGLMPCFIGDTDPALVPLEGADVAPLTLWILTGPSKKSVRPEISALRALLSREISAVLQTDNLGARKG